MRTPREPATRRCRTLPAWPGRREPPVCAMPIPSVSSTRSLPRRRSPPCAASGPANSRCTPTNDLGLATANTLAAVRAGATSVNTTVLGLGERAGNAALETVALGLERCLEVKTGVRFTALPALCEQVALATRRPVDPSSRWWASWSLPTNPACTLRRCCATARAIRRSTPPCWAAAIGWCWANTPVARRLTASSIGWVIT